MLDMVKASIRKLQHHLSEVMRYVDHGEEVLITRRNKVIAKIVPVTPDAGSVVIPDFAERARLIIRKPKGKKPSRVVVEERQERM